MFRYKHKIGAGFYRGIYIFHRDVKVQRRLIADYVFLRYGKFFCKNINKV